MTEVMGVPLDKGSDCVPLGDGRNGLPFDDGVFIDIW